MLGPRSYLSVYPYVRMEQLSFHWTDFDEIWYLSVFLKSVEKIQDLLKSEKENKGCFAWRPMYIYDSISLNSSKNKKYFKQNL